MRGRLLISIVMAAAVTVTAFTGAMAKSNSEIEAKMQKMMEAGLCKELGPGDKVPDKCTAYYGECYFKKFPISDADCRDASHSNRPLAKVNGKCVPISIEEINIRGEKHLINQESCGNENVEPNVTACKVWGRSYLGALKRCQVRMYWKEVYYCEQSYCEDSFYRTPLTGTYPNYKKGDKGNSWCDRVEYDLGYYYYITAHQSEMKLSCQMEENWKKSKEK